MQSRVGAAHPTRRRHSPPLGGTAARAVAQTPRLRLKRLDGRLGDVVGELRLLGGGAGRLAPQQLQLEPRHAQRPLIQVLQPEAVVRRDMIWLAAPKANLTFNKNIIRSPRTSPACKVNSHGKST